ncbi:MAG: hypothetical protein ACRCZO_14475 [Cetobacterium sp.]
MRNFFLKIIRAVEKVLLLKKKKKKYKSISKFCKEKKIINGIYEIKLSDRQKLSLLIKNLEYLDKSILINFTGAVSNRNGLKGPFFSGKHLSDTLKTPLVSISDPTLELDNEITLGWYAGNAEILDIPKKITEVIEHICKVLKVKPIIFGGSGGGFAGLNQARLLNIEADILIWNPQTSIGMYSKQFIEKYCEVAGFSSLEESGIVYDLCKVEKRVNCRIIYMQNSSDWHVKKHMKPYLERYNILMKSDYFGEDIDNNLYLYIDKWGEGHVAPSKRIIVEGLKALIRGEKIKKIIQIIHNIK